MISYLKGKIVVSKTGQIILDVSGVGYKIAISLAKMPKAGDSVELFIHEHIREDADDLYGFSTSNELDLFEQLISVNGVGPKVGMAIMSAGKVEDIVSAIISSNIAFFKSISGIGSKAAAKIILELKSKISADKSVSIGFLSDDDDVVEALVSLGYRKQELQSVLSKMPVLKSSEEKITWVLKNLAK